MTRRRRTRRSSRGQSLVEFALVFPIMVVVLFAIVDFARIYTSMMNVESAAREAADYGTEMGAGRWQTGTTLNATVAEMKHRACVATSNMADYQPNNPKDLDNCTNPAFQCSVTAPDTGMVYSPCETLDPAAGCDDPLRSDPCRITVTLSYDFHLLAPFHIELHGARFGFPSVITFRRDSTFAMTDIDLSPSAAPSAGASVP